jgi:hypothetical protein
VKQQRKSGVYAMCMGVGLQRLQKRRSELVDGIGCSDSIVRVEALEQMMGRGGHCAEVFTCREDIITSSREHHLVALDPGRRHDSDSR